METTALDNLKQQIQELESQLKSMRGDYQSRQSELSRLRKQQMELQTELQRVDNEIAVLMQGDAAQVPKLTAASAKSATATKPKSKQKAKKKPAKTVKATQPAAAPKSKRPQTGPVLREVLTDILKKARKPLTSRELADRALAAGYQTRSTNFVNVVLDLLKKMDDVERVPNQGYQLK